MTDVVFSLPAVLTAIVAALGLALWPKRGWGPADYAFAATSVLFCVAALGAGLMLVEWGGLGLLFTVPVYLIASLVAIMATYTTVRTTAEARAGLVRMGPRVILRGLYNAESGGMLFALPGLAVFFLGLFAVWTEEVGGNLLLVIMAGALGAALLAFAMPPARSTIQGWTLGLLGLLGLAASLCAGPTALQGFEIRSTLEDLPVFEGANLRRTEIRSLAREAERTWEAEASLPDVARFYDQALRETGWKGNWHWAGFPGSVRVAVERQGPYRAVSLTIRGGVSSREPPNDIDLDTILGTFDPAPRPLSIEVELFLEPESIDK